MEKNLKYIILFAVIATVAITACTKAKYSFGSIAAPTNLSLTPTIQGANTANPTGDGSGNVLISVSAANAITYKIFLGNGDSVLTSSGQISYKYTKLDTNTYTVTANAIGTGGATATLSKQIKVLYKYQIPTNIIALLTNGSSKNWMVAKDTVGHFGVGPITSFTPDWYKAAPNEKPSCAYAGTITFTQVNANTISMIDNNLNSSFLTGASTAFYGQSGGDGCYVVNTGGTKTLGFSGANSGSSTSNSTGVQFNVPGNGLVNFGTGGSTYEIISLSTTVMVLRNIGSDGNAWYQILKAK
ncbi:hypothetical protein [Mucilaginibacter paludis]|uniref:Glycosyl hydrolase family protein n=1 Tax=Mucilaginibacter paludis DSM 18603 TaxID=714943 RepID=H1YIE2_9SPHI|nr:hypothetical protein [Mucilaginibacter paludis]EHQ27555.1 glycosyl hydrolase family protein [Mucilaginibacter paludis DSM 18603]